MYSWRTAYDPKRRGLVHRTARGSGHALLAPLAARAFGILGVAAAVQEGGDNWVLIQSGPSLQGYEVDHAWEHGRYVYNAEMIERARTTKKTVRGEHRGLSDVFAPIVVRDRVVGMLVTGPFLVAAPTSTGIAQAWRELTGREGHLADPEFAGYLATHLSLLVLEGRRADQYAELVDCVARLMSGQGRADNIANRIEQLRFELERARFAERAWDAVRSIVDEQVQRTSQIGRANDLRDMGLTLPADHVIVAMTVSKKPDADPVHETVVRHALQRAVAELMFEAGDAIAGQLGSRGVVILCGARGPVVKRRRRVQSLVEKVAALAGKRFGHAVHAGWCAIDDSVSIGPSYRAALAAAESALARGDMLESAQTGAAPADHPLRELRRRLGVAVEREPELFSVRFDRYLDAVLTHCRHRMDIARAQLEAGFERATEPLVGSGALDGKSLRALTDRLERSADAALVSSELLSAYRQAMHDVVEAVERPGRAHRDRSLLRALEFMRLHCGEPLSRAQVARIAGFSPAHFSVVFAKHQHKTFERYLSELRMEQAKRLLEDSDLPIARVARLSGFSSARYFSSAFRKALRMAPIAYRKRRRRVPEK